MLAKLTTTLAQRHDVVVIEDLNVAGMGRRKPGMGRRGRSFNRALADAALGELRRQLTYKCQWYGAVLVVADRWYPSTKTCSRCGARKPRLHLRERTFVCSTCGLVIDRDHNAAINLARLGEPTQGNRGPPGVARWLDVEPTRRPSRARQVATKRQPRVGVCRVRRGPSLRKERLPDPTRRPSANGTATVVR